MKTSPHYPQPGAGKFLETLKRARAATRSGGSVVMAWNGQYLDAAGLSKWIADNIDWRINRKGGLWDTGRKQEPAYQVSLRRDAIAINRHFSERLRLHRGLITTPELVKRYQHLWADNDD